MQPPPLRSDPIRAHLRVLRRPQRETARRGGARLGATRAEPLTPPKRGLRNWLSTLPSLTKRNANTSSDPAQELADESLNNMLPKIDRARPGFSLTAVVALGVLSLLGSSCQEAPQPDPRPVVPPKPATLARAQPSTNPPAAGPINAPTMARATTSPPARSSSSPIPLGPVVIAAIRMFGGERPDAARLIRDLKPAFVRCYERALKRHPARSGQLQGRVRLAISVDASGTVSEVDLPQWDPRNPMWDAIADGSPRPNPTSAHLRAAVIPCMEARVRESRFGASEGPFTITVDVRMLNHPSSATQ